MLREGRQPVRGETLGFASGSTRSATARPRAAGTRPDPQRPIRRSGCRLGCRPVCPALTHADVVDVHNLARRHFVHLDRTGRVALGPERNGAALPQHPRTRFLLRTVRQPFDNY